MSLVEGAPAGAAQPAPPPPPYPPRAFHMPSAAIPHRKPVAPNPNLRHTNAQPALESLAVSNAHQIPQSSLAPQQQQQQQQQQPPLLPQNAHSRTRTASSSLLPTVEQINRSAGPLPPQPLSKTSPPPPSFSYTQQQPPQTMTNEQSVQYQQHMNQHVHPLQKPTRRSFSATSTASSNSGVPVRQNSGSSLQRSTSSRSGGTPMSYVALMRKQKATVWSDRAQHEDPRMLAQRHAAKLRAAAEVSSIHAGRTYSAGGGVRSKIRHHGMPKAREFIGAGEVPLRLSQNEMDEVDGEDMINNYTRLPSGLGMGGHGGPAPLHTRTGSGRSSLGSAGPRGYSSQGFGQGASPDSQTPPSHGSLVGQSRSAVSPEETPVPGSFRGQEYFDSRDGRNATKVIEGPYRGNSTGSGNSAEKEEQFGQAKNLPMRVRNGGVNEGNALDDEEARKQMEADLRRRGSVDERTMTMSTGLGRLYIANPDS